MIYEDRLKKGKEFEDKLFKELQRYNEIPHGSDRVIWRDGQPIWVEIKSSMTIEWESWLDQWKIKSKGYKVILIGKDCETDIIMADWIENIKIIGPLKGNKKTGSGNPFGIVKFKRILKKFLEDELQ